MMNIHIEPQKALTGFLDIPGAGKFRLDFLITHESGMFHIRCLNFGIMSCGKTVEECKENIQEAIIIYLEDLPEGENLFKPSPAKYWKIFYEIMQDSENMRMQKLSTQQKLAIQSCIATDSGLELRYA